MTDLVIDIDTFEVEDVKTERMKQPIVLLSSLVTVSFKTIMLTIPSLIKQRLYEHFKRKEKPDETILSSS